MSVVPTRVFPWLIVFIDLTRCFAQSPVLFKGESDVRITFESIAYLGAGDSVKTVAMAKGLLERGRFAKNKLPDLNLGIARDDYWIAFKIKNTTPDWHELYINLENPRLNEVQVFVVRNDSIQPALTLGDIFPFYDRSVEYRQFTFPMTLAPAQTNLILLFVKHKGNTLQMPIQVLKQNAFLSLVEGDYLFAGIVSGIFFITFLFGVFFLFNTQDPLFIYYSGYLLSAGAWVWTTEGLAFQYLWPNAPELATRLGPGVSAVSACFFIANCLQFCRPYDANSILRKILMAILFFLVVWSSTPFLPFVPITEKTMSVYLSVYFSINILVSILLVAYLVFISRKGYSVVLYYLSAVVVTIGCSVVSVLRGSGVIDVPLSTSTIMSSGYVVELILMTAGITKQFYNYRKEKEDALMMNIEQQKLINEKIIQTQKDERNRISRELHDDIGPRITQITMMSEIAKKSLPPGSASARELAEIADTSRDLVANMGEIVWSLNPENRTLRDLLSYLREQLNKLLEYAGMNYEITFEPDQDGTLNHTQLRNILLVTKEIVHNAVKHSGAKKIIIHCATQNNRIHFMVSDNGIGIDLSKPTHGNGMRNIRTRLAEVDGSLTIETSPGGGGKFSYTVPL